MTTIYIDWIGGRYEAWRYLEGRKIVVAVHQDRYDCVKIGTRNSGYEPNRVTIVYTKEAQRRHRGSAGEA